MPTYQYECDHCHAAFEAMQSITEPKLKTCPHCHQDTLCRLIGSGAGFIFKGTGFYETDYKRSQPKGEAKPVEKESCPSCPSKKSAQ